MNLFHMTGAIDRETGDVGPVHDMRVQIADRHFRAAGVQNIQQIAVFRLVVAAPLALIASLYPLDGQAVGKQAARGDLVG